MSDPAGIDDQTAYTVLVVFPSRRMGPFLVARHRARGWELPGGRIEPHEGLIEAARREWSEETGLPLGHVEPLVLHERPDGSTGHVLLGAVVDSVTIQDPTALEALAEPLRDDKIDAIRFIASWDEVSPLAFPDDPYGEVADVIRPRLERHDGVPAPAPKWMDDNTYEPLERRLVPPGHHTAAGHHVRIHPGATQAAPRQGSE